MLDKPGGTVERRLNSTAMVLKTPDFPKNYFVPGRMAMTCCEADMTFLGFHVQSQKCKALRDKRVGQGGARVEYEYSPNMKARDRCFYAEYVEKAEPIKAIVQF